MNSEELIVNESIYSRNRLDRYHFKEDRGTQTAEAIELGYGAPSKKTVNRINGNRKDLLNQ
jgi:hypothetical protein